MEIKFHSHSNKLSLQKVFTWDHSLVVMTRARRICSDIIKKNRITENRSSVEYELWWKMRLTVKWVPDSNDVVLNYGKTSAWYCITWQELSAGKKLTPVQFPPLRHITAHSTRDLAFSTGPATVSSTSCQPALYTPLVGSHVSIPWKRSSKRGSIGKTQTSLNSVVVKSLL